MRNPLSQRTQQIQGSGIRRFFSMAAGVPDVISLGVGEPDFDTPWHVREAAIQAIQEGKTFYTANAGLEETRRAIADFVSRKYQLSYNFENEIMMTIGCSEGIDLAMRILVDPGDEVIVMDPSYVSYLPTILLSGGVPVPVRLEESEKFKLTPEKLEMAITEKTKLLVISFPNNPTGAIMTKEELRKIAEIVKQHDIYVLSDEVYSELTYTNDKKHCSIASFDGMKERTIVLNGLSKAFAMTGWRLGYVLAPSFLLDEMIKIHQYTAIAPSTIGQYASVSAFNNSDEDIDRMRTSYNQRRRYLLHTLNKMGINCFEPEGAFYLFVNIQQFGLSSEAFCERLLEEEKLAVVPGDAFGSSGEGYVRISYAYSLKQLEAAMEKLEAFISRLRN